MNDKILQATIMQATQDLRMKADRVAEPHIRKQLSEHLTRAYLIARNGDLSGLNGAMPPEREPQEIDLDQSVGVMQIIAQELNKLKDVVKQLEVSVYQRRDRNFEERVIECFDTDEFRLAVGYKIADYLENDEKLLTLQDVEDLLAQTTFTLRVR